MSGMKFWPRWIALSGCVLLLQVSFAQQVSYHITPLRPVPELRAEALQSAAAA